MPGSSVSALFLPHSTLEIGRSPGSHDGLSNEGLELVGLVNDTCTSDSSGSLSVVEDTEVFYKPSGCASFSGTCSKLLVETCIPLGDGDLHTSCTSWFSASFMKHSACSGIAGVWHTTSVTGLQAP